MSTDTRLVRIESMLVSRQRQIASVLPPTLTFERFARMMVNATHQTPQLLECDQRSLEIAALNCAALGLEPNSLLHQAVIIPRKSKGVMKAQLQVETPGLIQLARNTGEVIDIKGNAVREKDTFEYQYGRNADLSHKEARGARGDAIFFYAYAILKDGGFPFVVMTKKEVEDHRDRYSDAYRWAESGDPAKGGGKKDSPWHTEFEKMGIKTAIRQLWKQLPRSVAPVEAMERAYSSGQQPILVKGAAGQVEIEVEPEEGGADDAIDAEITEATTGQPAQTDPQPDKPRRGRPPKDRSQQAQAPPKTPPEAVAAMGRPIAVPAPPEVAGPQALPVEAPAKAAASASQAASGPMRGVTVPPGFKGWPGPTQAAFLADLEEKRGYKIDPGSVIEEAIPSKLGPPKEYGLPAKQQEEAPAEAPTQPDRPLSPAEIEQLQGAARTAGVPWKWINQAVIHYMAPFSAPERMDGFDRIDDVPVSLYDDLMAFCQGERGRPQQGKW